LEIGWIWRSAMYGLTWNDFVGCCFLHRWKWRCICFNFRLLCHFRLRPQEGSPHSVQAWNEMKLSEILAEAFCRRRKCDHDWTAKTHACTFC
jgi:hypothetical protein